MQGRSIRTTLAPKLIIPPSLWMLLSLLLPTLIALIEQLWSNLLPLLRRGWCVLISRSHRLWALIRGVVCIFGRLRALRSLWVCESHFRLLHGVIKLLLWFLLRRERRSRSGSGRGSVEAFEVWLLGVVEGSLRGRGLKHLSLHNRWTVSNIALSIYTNTRRSMQN